MDDIPRVKQPDERNQHLFAQTFGLNEKVVLRQRVAGTDQEFQNLQILHHFYGFA